MLATPAARRTQSGAHGDAFIMSAPQATASKEDGPKTPNGSDLRRSLKSAQRAALGEVRALARVLRRVSLGARCRAVVCKGALGARHAHVQRAAQGEGLSEELVWPCPRRSQFRKASGAACEPTRWQHARAEWGAAKLTEQRTRRKRV